MKTLSVQDQAVLRSMSEGTLDHDICHRLGISERSLRLSLGRIEAGATVGSDELGRCYERALKIRAQNRVLSLETRFRALIDILPNAVMIVDGRSGSIKQFNRKALDLFGYSEIAFSKLTVEQLTSEGFRAIHVSYRLAFLRNVRKREIGYHPPIIGIRADGSPIHIEIGLTSTPVDDDVMVVCTEQQEPVESPIVASEGFGWSAL